MADTLQYGPIRLYFANNSPQNPLCLYGQGGEGMSVAVYYDEQENVVGVQICENDFEIDPINIGAVPAEEA